MDFYHFWIFYSCIKMSDKQNKSSEQEGIEWLERIAETIHREIDCKKEHEEWIDERYESSKKG